MQASPRLVSPTPAPSPSAAPPPAASPSIPATCEHEHSSPGPYWPRLARALVLMFFAVSLHVWVVQSPEPQEPVYSTLAARLVSLVLANPPLPLAPPLRLITSRPSSSEPRVTLQTSLLNVPAVPGPPASSPAAVLEPTLDPGGTSGNTSRNQRRFHRQNDGPIGWTAHTPDVAPHLATAAPPAWAIARRCASSRAAGRAPAGADDRGGGRDPAARDSNPTRPRRRWIASPCPPTAPRSQPIGREPDPRDPGGGSAPPEGGRSRRGARIHARAGAARRPCHQGGLSIRRRSQASAIIPGRRGTAVSAGLLRRVVFLIGRRRQRAVSWQFDVPAESWIAGHPIHGSGMGVQPGAGWGRMADSRGADPVDGGRQVSSRHVGNQLL